MRNSIKKNTAVVVTVSMQQHRVMAKTGLMIPQKQLEQNINVGYAINFDKKNVKNEKEGLRSGFTGRGIKWVSSILKTSLIEQDQKENKPAKDGYESAQRDVLEG